MPVAIGLIINEGSTSFLLFLWGPKMGCVYSTSNTLEMDELLFFSWGGGGARMNLNKKKLKRI